MGRDFGIYGGATVFAQIQILTEYLLNANIDSWPQFIIEEMANILEILLPLLIALAAFFLDIPDANHLAAYEIIMNLINAIREFLRNIGRG